MKEKTLRLLFVLWRQNGFVEVLNIKSYSHEIYARHSTFIRWSGSSLEIFEA